jgi:hypothetical protein
MTPTATLTKYDPADGVGVNVGSVHVRNAVAIINDDGKTISLVVTILNGGSRSANVDLQFDSAGEKTTVTKPIDAGDSVSYGNTDEDQILIRNPDVEAGALLPIYVQYGDHEGKMLLVPVLEGTGIYEDLKPPETAS